MVENLKNIEFNLQPFDIKQPHINKPITIGPLPPLPEFSGFPP
jgi:hypothetical protein